MISCEEANLFYVYVYLDQHNVPYYVGKGVGKRAWHKKHEVVVPKDQTKIHFIDSFMSEEDALFLETEAIKKWGRSCLGEGPLLNKRLGGAGRKRSTSVSKPTKPIKQRKSYERTPPTSLTKQKISISNKQAWDNGTRKKMSGYPCKYTYINNGVVTKRVPAHLVVPSGWVKGRLFWATKNK